MSTDKQYRFPLYKKCIRGQKAEREGIVFQLSAQQEALIPKDCYSGVRKLGFPSLLGH